MNVDLVDGTYELFRHFYGLRRFTKGDPAAVAAGQDPAAVAAGQLDRPYGAVLGVVRTIVSMLESGSTHVGVATDHVIESFRNAMWQGYKTGDGIEPALLAQFHPLEDALGALGVAVWAMTELEADDALASAAHLAAADARVTRVSIWTPDKDLAQCVRGDRVVQVDRKSGAVRGEEEVEKKFGVRPALIADYLALVGDAADGYPGLPGIGAKTAARMLNMHGAIDAFPPGTISDVESALLFRRLATLRTDAPLFASVDEIEWRGPRADFAAWAERIGDSRLPARCEAVLAKRAG
jgi:5'-3' exonuclease